MYNHQTCITMKVEIENTFFVWDKEMTDMYVTLVNVLVSAQNERQLREAITAGHLVPADFQLFII